MIFGARSFHPSMRVRSGPAAEALTETMCRSSVSGAPSASRMSESSSAIMAISSAGSITVSMGGLRTTPSGRRRPMTLAVRYAWSASPYVRPASAGSRRR